MFPFLPETNDEQELDMEDDEFQTLLHPYPTSFDQQEPPHDSYEHFGESVGIEAKYLPEPIEDEEWYWVWA